MKDAAAKKTIRAAFILSFVGYSRREAELQVAHMWLQPDKS